MMSQIAQEPEEIGESIVNKKKINEVRTWLRNKINWNGKDKCLLVSGPAGCGKSTTIRLLCDELDIACEEFELGSGNIIDQNEDRFNEFKASQIDLFRNFVSQSQASTIERRTRTRKLILIKELPITMINEPEKLYTFLREVLPNLSVFLVFSLTSIGTTWKLSPNRIFPDEILTQFMIQHIKFNAVPKTTMTKVVQKWIDTLGVPKNTKFLQSIVEKADGDLKSAMSLVEICCVSKKLIDSEFVAKSDTPIDIFHFLGKILYAKRLEKADGNWESTECLLDEGVKPEYRRECPPKDDLSELWRASTLSNSAMIDFIMEHEFHFCRLLKPLSRVYEDVCQVLAMSSPFEIQLDQDSIEMNRQTIIRSVIFNNYRANENIQKVQYKFRKSDAVKVSRRCSALITELNSIYPSTGLVDTISYTIPLLGKVNSFIKEEEAQLCEKIRPNLKINPKRIQQVQSSRLQFEICNEDD